MQFLSCSDQQFYFRAPVIKSLLLREEGAVSRTARAVQGVFKVFTLRPIDRPRHVHM